MTETVAVAVPRPVTEVYTYLLPKHMQGGIIEGCRVVVPLGSSRIVGLVWEANPVVSPEIKPKLKNVLQRLDSTPTLGGSILQLVKWAANYYIVPPGMMASAAFPPGMQGNALRIVSIGTDSVLRKYTGKQNLLEYKLLRALLPPEFPLEAVLAEETIQNRVNSWWQPIKLPKPQKITFVEPLLPPEKLTSAGYSLKSRAPKQANILITLAMTGTIRKSELLRKSRASCNSLERLQQQRLVKETVRNVPRDPMLNTHSVENKPPPTLNRYQHSVVEKILATVENRATSAVPGGIQRKHATFLLHGITGSGKTEIYLKLIEREIAANRGAIVLVPEISLTPLAVSRFNNRFPGLVAVLHSGLSPGERLDTWNMIRDGKRKIVIGPRSAVFAPVQNLGIVVVDEEHDDSYKQGSLPHYNGRDLAVVRGSIENIPVVLGSASPSCESWHNALRNRYILLSLPERATRKHLPKVRLVDSNKSRFPLLSDELLSAVGRRTASGEQSIILINRRGHSPIQMCFACGYVEKCPSCGISMTYHRHGEILRCHHCGYWKSAKTRCPECHGEEYIRQGPGIQKVEDALKKLLPKTKVIRMDADTTTTKSSHWKIIQKFAQGGGDVLLGTQMVAKGHDFPNVTLAAVIGAEMGLYMPDFRAQERTFDLLLQLSGRSGRGDKTGEVIIQTTDPDNFVIQLASAHDYKTFITHELEMRRRLANPPITRMVRLLWSGKSQEKVSAAAERTCKTPLPKECALLGPSEAVFGRLADKWRYNALIKAPKHSILKTAVTEMKKTFDELRQTTVRMDIDVDPRNMM